MFISSYTYIDPSTPDFFEIYYNNNNKNNGANTGTTDANFGSLGK